MTRRLILALILVVYFILGILFAVNTPPWQAPDEPAHYNYVAYVVKNGSFPVLHFGDYPHGYLEQIKTANFPPDMPITSIRYESHQPPSYYLLAAPVYVLTNGNLILLRLLSVLLGAGIVLFAYGIGRRAVPADPAIGLGAAAIVAFLPQHLATVSQVGNDVLAELLFAAVLFVSIGMLANPASRASFRAYLLLGVLLGLILITKTTAYIAVPLALGVVAWRWLRAKPPFHNMALEALVVILPVALIALPWYLRDIYVYGWPDFLGLIRHEQIVVGQPRTADFIAQNGWNAYWSRAAEWTFKSFVGVFGWMGVWMDSRVYYVAGLWLATPVAGWIVDRILRSGHELREKPGGSGQVYAFLAVSVLLTLLTYVYYNITFLQHQGRYLFSALIPISVFLALGWHSALRPRVARVLAGVMIAWCAIMAVWGIATGSGLPKWPIAITVALTILLVVVGFIPERFRRWAYALPFALLPLLSAYALFGAIVPAFALPSHAFRPDEAWTYAAQRRLEHHG